MPNWARVLLACAAGAFVGTLVALQVNPIFWWIGLLTGAIVGWVGYDPLAVVRAAPRAWRLATRNWAEVAFGAVIICAAVGYLMALVGLVTTMAVGLAIIDFAATGGEPPVPLPLGGIDPYLVAVIGVHIVWLAIAPTAALMALSAAFDAPARVCFLAVAKATLIHNVYFRLLPRAVMWMIRGTPTALRAIFIELPCVLGNFFKFLFIATHTELRLMCAVDAALGAGIGYLVFANPIAGAIAGAIIGVANYWLLTPVAKRLKQRA